MEKNERKTNYSIKSKLVSAIAMLLVATIMVVSSTYAWFTLSTAPEVTGISTAVGANGALEMVLLSTRTNNQWDYMTGSVTDKSPTERNNYWGNLVDLSNNATYGSNLISLYPSELTLTDGKLSLMHPLSTPKYGSDGRVEDTIANTEFAKYNGSQFFKDSTNYGFRGLGVASGLTTRQKALRDAISGLAAARYEAQTEARKSLSENGTTLANIAVKKGLKGDAATFNQAEVNAIDKMLDGLNESLLKVEEAYIQSIYAIIAGKETSNGATDTEAATAADTVKEEVGKVTATTVNAKLTAAFAALGDKADTVKSALLGYGTYEAAIESLTDANSAFANIDQTDEEYTWGDISATLTYLVNVNNVTVCDLTMEQVKTDEGKTTIFNAALNSGVYVKIPSGGGVYADIADLCGDYTVDVEIDSATLDAGISGLTVKATMTADSTIKKDDNTTPADPYLTQILDIVKAKSNTPDSEGGEELPITEFYGYVIDLGFKTNAANSKLLLQTTAADRIYDGNKNEETMGNGSTMTFKSSDANFAEKDVKELMKNLRVVFYETLPTGDYATVYATAKLDLSDGAVTVDDDGVTAALRIIGADGNFSSDNAITSLDPNTAKQISVLVYLDGATIENSDVAATAAQSMTGTLNLQFASSAELVPMEYADLHHQ